MFGFWEPFVLLGGIAFWAILFVLFVTFVWCIEFERTGPAALLLIASYMFFWGAVGFNPAMWAYYNPGSALIYIGGYFVGGTVWSVIKWWFYLLRRRDEAKALKEYFEDHHDKLEDDWTKAEQEDEFNFKNWMNNPIIGYGRSGGSHGWSCGFGAANLSYGARSYPPQAVQHKGDILFWMTYWPFSAFWTILNDPIRRAWNAIYSIMGGMLQKMSNKVFQDI